MARYIPMRDTIRRQAKTPLPCWSLAFYLLHGNRGLLGVLRMNAALLDDDALHSGRA